MPRWHVPSEAFAPHFCLLAHSCLTRVTFLTLLISTHFCASVRMHPMRMQVRTILSSKRMATAAAPVAASTAVPATAPATALATAPVAATVSAAWRAVPYILTCPLLRTDARTALASRVSLHLSTTQLAQFTAYARDDGARVTGAVAALLLRALVLSDTADTVAAFPRIADALVARLPPDEWRAAASDAAAHAMAADTTARGKRSLTRQLADAALDTPRVVMAAYLIVRGAVL